MLLFFALIERTFRGDQDHSGVWVKPLVIYDTELLVGSLLILQAKPNPCSPFRGRSRSRRRGSLGH